jgi:hypothetical protein
LKAEAIVEGAKGVAEAMRDVSEETKEYRKIMGSLEVSSAAAGYSAEETETAYKKLYGILADDQSTATTVANLQALRLPQEKLLELIDNTVGGWAKYGDSIPIDGLAEAINETAKTGQVTGNFADILNWASLEGETFGVSLKENIEFTELSAKELEALTGKKDSRFGGHNGHRAKSRDIMAAEYGFSSRTAARMLRLNYLIPEFKKLVDEGSVALLAAVDMSFLEESEQQAIWKLLNRQGLKLKPKAAAELRKHGGELTEERIVEILDALSINKRSGNEGLNLKLPNSLCEKYFSGMESAEMASIVEQALDAWFSGKGAAYVQS